MRSGVFLKIICSGFKVIELQLDLNQKLQDPGFTGFESIRGVEKI
jgi:hypothetical protein